MNLKETQKLSIHPKYHMQRKAIISDRYLWFPIKKQSTSQLPVHLCHFPGTVVSERDIFTPVEKKWHGV